MAAIARTRDFLMSNGMGLLTSTLMLPLKDSSSMVVICSEVIFPEGFIRIVLEPLIVVFPSE